MVVWYQLILAMGKSIQSLNTYLSDTADIQACDPKNLPAEGMLFVW